MLYCLQVSPMQEIKTEKEIRVIVPETLCSSCFHLTRKRWRKYHGNRHIVTERLLPGYIFLDSDDLDGLYENLRRVPTLTKILGLKAWDLTQGSSEGFSQLDDVEEDMIRRLALGEGAAAPGMIDISGLEISEGKRVRVVNGPLTGLESRISKVDLHHGTATVAVKILGKTVELLVGVEDLTRTPEPMPQKKKQKRQRRRVSVTPADE